MLTDSKTNAAQCGRFVGSPTVVDLPSTVAVTIGPLKPRTLYGIYFTATGTFKWGIAGVTATDADHFSTAGQRTYHTTDDTNLYVSCKVPTATGKAQLAEIALD